jgi:hypothetical protein
VNDFTSDEVSDNTIWIGESPCNLYKHTLGSFGFSVLNETRLGVMWKNFLTTVKPISALNGLLTPPHPTPHITVHRKLQMVLNIRDNKIK